MPPIIGLAAIGELRIPELQLAHTRVTIINHNVLHHT